MEECIMSRQANPKYQVIYYLATGGLTPADISQLNIHSLTTTGITVADKEVVLKDDQIIVLGDYIVSNQDKIKASGYLFPAKNGDTSTPDGIIVGMRNYLKKELNTNLASIGWSTPPKPKAEKPRLKTLVEIIAFFSGIVKKEPIPSQTGLPLL
jgi:hypothetical protein